MPTSDTATTIAADAVHRLQVDRTIRSLLGIGGLRTIAPSRWLHAYRPIGRNFA
jgi:hypothetical protein